MASVMISVRARLKRKRFVGVLMYELPRIMMEVKKFPGMPMTNSRA